MPIASYTSPIWKDTYANLGQVASVEYLIYLNDVVIFSGVAYRRPGESNLVVRINDICADYLTHPVPAFNAGTPFVPTQMVMALDYSKTFRVRTRILSGENYIYTDIADFTFTNDWSFNRHFDTEASVLSDPIDYRLSPYQVLLYSENSDTANLHTSYLVNDAVADFNEDFNDDYDTDDGVRERDIFAYGIEGPRVFTLDMSSYGGTALETLTIGSKVWKVSRECASYVLHYVNAYGGWDSFLVGGNTLQEDGVKHYERGRQGMNADRVTAAYEARTRDNYLNVLTPRFVFHTAPLNTDEASRMHHLLNSPLVFLEDMSGAFQEMYPIVLTGSTTSRATYKSNGNKLVEFTIEAELAEDRIRR